MWLGISKGLKFYPMYRQINQPLTVSWLQTDDIIFLDQRQRRDYYSEQQQEPEYIIILCQLLKFHFSQDGTKSTRWYLHTLWIVLQEGSEVMKTSFYIIDMSQAFFFSQAKCTIVVSFSKQLLIEISFKRNQEPLLSRHGET